MSGVPASSHGGGTFAGGTITPTTDPGLAVSVPDSTFNAIAVLEADHGGAVAFTIDAFGNLSCGQANVAPIQGVTALAVTGFDTTHYLAAFTPSTGNPRVLVNPAGYLMVKAQAAPPDAAVLASYVMFWFDSTNGAAKLMLKGKTDDGTVVTASVALA